MKLVVVDGAFPVPGDWLYVVSVDGTRVEALNIKPPTIPREEWREIRRMLREIDWRVKRLLENDR